VKKPIWTVIWLLSFAALVAALILLWWRFGLIVPAVVWLCMLGDLMIRESPWAEPSGNPG